MNVISTDQITGLILCGGAGSRLGGIDKGLASFHGKTLVDIVISKLAPDVSSILISANRNISDYEKRGLTVIKDKDWQDDGPSYDGPLAGILTGLEAANTEWLMVVPCDCPTFPQETLAELAMAAQHDRKAAYVAGHPTFAMIPVHKLHALQVYLQHGHRKLEQWLKEIGATAVACSNEDAFRNLNTPQDFPQS